MNDSYWESCARLAKAIRKTMQVHARLWKMFRRTDPKAAGEYLLLAKQDREEAIHWSRRAGMGRRKVGRYDH